jgi:hemerythrin
MITTEVIDQQHRHLLQQLNELNSAVTAGESRANLYKIIDDVIEYTRFHFSMEEQFMVETGFDDLEWHREKHRQLVDDAIGLKEKLNYIGEELFTDWFVHWPFGRVLAHIQYADRQFEAHLRAHAQAR